MASVEIYEFAGSRGDRQLRAHPMLAKQVLTSGTTTATSATFSRSTVAITAISTDTWRGSIGVSPTSTGAHFLVPANTYFDADVIAGQKIIALSSTTT